MTQGQQRFAIGLIAVVGVLFLGFYMWSRPPARDKVDALGDVVRTVGDADMHHGVVIQCGKKVFRARHNLDIITRVAGIVGTVGSNTMVYMAVADAAADAEAECPVLDELLDLALMKQSESMTLIGLIETACAEKSSQDEVLWAETFQYLYDRREYPSVEEALAALQKG